MLGQISLWVAQATKIDNAADTGGCRRVAEVASSQNIALAKFVVAAHAVNQVIGYVYTVQGCCQVCGLQHVADEHIHVMAPGATAQSFWTTADHHPHLVTLG